MCALEEKGLKAIGLKMVRLSKDKIEELYSPHKGKDFYEMLINFMSSGPVVCVALEGKEAIQIVRKLIGATRPLESAPGSIRGDFSMDTTHNLVHAADSPENAQRELSIVFDAAELLVYKRCDEVILYSKL